MIPRNAIAQRNSERQAEIQEKIEQIEDENVQEVLRELLDLETRGRRPPGQGGTPPGQSGDSPGGN